MKATRFFAVAALLASAAANAQAVKANPGAKIGASKDSGHGRSIANDQQQIEADKFKMREAEQSKDKRKYKKSARQLQRDQEQLNRDTTR